MARPPTIDDRALLEKLSGVFRDVGYDGASLSTLSDVTGLKRASLYHRFPGGKEQMAREVLVSAEEWLTEHVLMPLRTPGPAAARIRAMVGKLDQFYSRGRQACLLNMLSSPYTEGGPFADLIRTMFTAWAEALSAVLVDAGFDRETASFRAERAIALVQGSLVMSRGLHTTRPFRTCLANLERELLT